MSKAKNSTYNLTEVHLVFTIGSKWLLTSTTILYFTEFIYFHSILFRHLFYLKSIEWMAFENANCKWFMSAFINRSHSRFYNVCKIFSICKPKVILAACLFRWELLFLALALCTRILQRKFFAYTKSKCP